MSMFIYSLCSFLRKMHDLCPVSVLGVVLQILMFLGP